jgi:DNA-directed RNA polymerase specialized sigma24 family protein
MSRKDAELLAATAAGDADAFGCFYRRHEALVLAYAVHRCTNASDVADLVGDTFVGASRSAPLFAERDGDAVAWLLTIARRALAHQRREPTDRPPTSPGCAISTGAESRSAGARPLPVARHV